MEKIISEKKLRSTLNLLADIENSTIYDKIETKARITDSYGYLSGDVVITNKSPYNFEYGQIKCQVKFYSHNGLLVNTEDIFIDNLRAYSSTSGMVNAMTNGSSKFKIVPIIIQDDILKNKIKEHIISTTQYDCF